jgi:hypothetical protein
MPSYSLFTVVVSSAAVLYAITVVYRQINLYFARRRFQLENGCEPLQKYYPLKDPIFGIDGMFETLAAAKEQRLLERANNNYKKYGNTFASKLFRQRVIVTIEPQNVKTVLSLRFKDFGIGNREVSFGKLLGQGIFVGNTNLCTIC